MPGPSTRVRPTFTPVSSMPVQPTPPPSFLPPQGSVGSRLGGPRPFPTAPPPTPLPAPTPTPAPNPNGYFPNGPATGVRGYAPHAGSGPGINLVDNQTHNPQGLPGQIYNHDLSDPWWAGNTNSPRGRTGYNYGDPLYWQNTPGFEGKAWLSSILQDPYAIPEASKRAAMSGVEDAYSTASQRVRNDTLGSGAAGGGVARGVRGNVETARASGMANAIRDFEQQKQQVGDERLRSLWLPWNAQNNQNNQTSYNAMLGQRNLDAQNNNSSGIEDLLGTALQAYMAYQTYGASSALNR